MLIDMVLSLPIDVNTSDWDHRLIDGGPQQDVIQLGLRLVKGLTKRDCRATYRRTSRWSVCLYSGCETTRETRQGRSEALSAADALRVLTIGTSFIGRLC